MALAAVVALTAALSLAPTATATHLPPVPAAAPVGVSLDGANNRIIYKARDAEFNSITVTETAGDYVFTETGTTEGGLPILPVDNAPGSPCTVDAGVTTCPKAGIDSIAVLGGDETGIISFTHDSITMDANPPSGTLLDGGAGNDDILGSPGDDDLFGREGIDNLNARNGDDSVTTGPSGRDDFEFLRFQIAFGGKGFDELRYDDRPATGSGAGPVQLNFAGTPLTRDSDTLNCPEDPDFGFPAGCTDSLAPDLERLVGSEFDDEIIGGSLGSVLVGMGGNDTLCGGTGVDTVDYSESSAGVDVTLDGTLESDERHTFPVNTDTGRNEYNKARSDCREIVFETGVPVPGGERDCTADDGIREGPDAEQDCVGEDVENIIGSEFNDRLVGNSPDRFEGGGPKVEPHGINKIEGRGGDDFIDGVFGPDALSGGDGDDTVTYESRVQPVSAAIDGAPNDGTKIDGTSLDAIRFSDFDHRTQLSDSIEADVEHIIGGPNDDTLRGDGDPNAILGGLGNDYIDGGAGADHLEGETGADTIDGGDGSDTLLGGADADVLDGEAGDDNVQGDAGGDSVKGGPGADLLSGGGDGSQDRVDYSDATTPVKVSADGVNDDGRHGEADNVLPDFEEILGGAADDVLAGGPASELIRGGDGDDLLAGGGGADDLSGGTGADAVTYAGAAGAVFVNLAEAGNDGEAGENDYVLEDVEGVHGGPGDDTLLGDGKANVLLGRSGNDRLAGAEDDDLLVGGVGSDALSGDVGADTLFGSDGNDNLAGGDGNDDLKGEAGNDTLDGGSGADRQSGGPHTDTILYSARSAGVTVNLDGKDKNGQSNENDFINNDVENVTTGRGPDAIDSDDNKRSEVRCGAGTDVVTADPEDRVNADCENVRVSALGTRCSASGGKVTMAKSGAIRVRVFCAVNAKGSLRLQSVTRVRTSKSRPRKILKLGRKSFSLKAGQRKTITVKASKAARRYIQRKKRLSVKARITARPAGKKSRVRTSRVFTVRGRR